MGLTQTIDKKTIKYPQFRDEYLVKRNEYFIGLLSLVIKYCNAEYQLIPIILPPTVDSRSRRALKEKLYDVNWMLSSWQDDTELLPIKIPLLNGLAGWKVLSIRKGDQYLFRGINSFRELNNFSVLQGHDWPDRNIYEHYGFTIRTSSHLRSLYAMLSNNRGDFLPRSVIDIAHEASLFQNLKLEVEPSILIKYTSAYHFYVRKDDESLYTCISTGLQELIKDGQFETYFYKNFQRSLLDLNISRRRVFEIDNINLVN